MLKEPEWKMLELPLSKKYKPKAVPHFQRDYRNQCHKQGLGGCRVIISTSSSFYACAENYGSQKMIVNYHKPNQVMTVLAATVPDIVSLIDKLTHPLVPGMQLLICQMHFSLSLSIRTTRSSFLSLGKTSNIPLPSYFRGISTMQLYGIVQFTGILITFCWKRQSHTISLSTPARPCKNGPWAWNTSLAKDRVHIASAGLITFCGNIFHYFILLVLL